jgi:hypothetical protein
MLAVVASGVVAFAHGKDGGGGHRGRDIASAVALATQHGRGHQGVSPGKPGAGDRDHDADNRGAGARARASRSAGDEDENGTSAPRPERPPVAATPAPTLSVHLPVSEPEGIPVSSTGTGVKAVALPLTGPSGTAALTAPSRTGGPAAPAPSPQPAPGGGGPPGGAATPAPAVAPVPPIQPIGAVGTPIIAGHASASMPVAVEVAFVVVACLLAGIVGSRLLARRR